MRFDSLKCKILVTGADGFIGSHLVDFLISSGYEVRALVHYNSFNSWGWLDSYSLNCPSNLEIVAGDIRDPNGVDSFVKGCSVVFHLAALIAIPFSYISPDSYLDTNVKGTLNVLQSCKRYNVQEVLVTSTSEVYGTAKYVPIDELHPFQPQSPYSASKISADCIAESFYRSFDLPVKIVRPFNAYGPRQSGRAVIPTIITQLLCGSTEIHLGDLIPTRDFNYVTDIVHGFWEIFKSPKCIGQHINIATGYETSIGDIANSLIDIINPDAKAICDNIRIRPKKSEVYRLLGDSKKIQDLTSWKPKFDLISGLHETIDWFSSDENLIKYKHNYYNV